MNIEKIKRNMGAFCCNESSDPQQLDSSDDSNDSYNHPVVKYRSSPQVRYWSPPSRVLQSGRTRVPTQPRRDSSDSDELPSIPELSESAILYAGPPLGKLCSDYAVHITDRYERLGKPLAPVNPPDTTKFYRSFVKQHNSGHCPCLKHRTAHILYRQPLRRSNSVSSLFLEETAPERRHLLATVRCIALAVFYLIKSRSSNRVPTMFDEYVRPLTPDLMRPYASITKPDPTTIYYFWLCMLAASQATAECAVYALVLVERLLDYENLELTPRSWRRITLACIMVSSKTYSDISVWNIDYCDRLGGISLDDINEMERRVLTLLNFNVGVSLPIYLKYFYELRMLADTTHICLQNDANSKLCAMHLEKDTCKIVQKNLELVGVGMEKAKRWCSANDVTMLGLEASTRKVFYK